MGTRVTSELLLCGVTAGSKDVASLRTRWAAGVPCCHTPPSLQEHAPDGDHSSPGLFQISRKKQNVKYNRVSKEKWHLVLLWSLSFPGVSNALKEWRRF